ncbi:MAG: efflux RND transporter periplasmic adaptor subunit [Candidatus Methylomirabilis sp.]|nr:efflux RND transporter periplasmic adaptor subunit [Deltaproteobacteria bacterium]
MRKKIIYGLGAVVVLAVVALLWRGLGNSPEAQDLKTARAGIGDLKIEAAANGVINPDVEVIVKSKAGGEIIDFPFNEGDLVKKGEVVVSLDPETEEARAKQAEAVLLMAEARLEKARIALKDAGVRLSRQKRLYGDGIVSRQELDDSEIAFEKAGADVKLAEAELLQSVEALKEARDRLADTKIKSPFTGTILKKLVDRGQVISSTISSASDGTQIFSIANLDDIFVTAHIDEVDISKIKPGQEVEVRADSLPGKKFRGAVERVAPKGRTEMAVTVFDVVVRVTDEDKALLKPGMTADVKIVTSTRSGVLLVPREAIKTLNRKSGVYVVKGKEQEFVQVETGETDGALIEIRGGIGEGAEVVTSPVSPDRKDNRRRRFLI